MEHPRHQIVLITNAQVEAAGKLLAQAFFSDPLMVTIFSDDQERIGVLTWYYTTLVRSLSTVQGVYTTDDLVKGVAVWDPPGTLEEAPVWTEPFGGQSYRRLLKAIDFLTPFRQAELSGPYWYLSWIGVAPAYRGQKLGSALLAPVLRQADQAGLPCYLETFDQNNLFFYQPHGFEVVYAETEPESNVPFWALKREPRSHAGMGEGTGIRLPEHPSKMG